MSEENNVSLREYFDRILEERDKALIVALAAQEKAAAAAATKTSLVVTITIAVLMYFLNKH